MNEPINIIFQVQNFPYPIAVSVTVRYNKTLPWLVIYSIHLKICHPIAASVSPLYQNAPMIGFTWHSAIQSLFMKSSPLYIYRIGPLIGYTRQSVIQLLFQLESVKYQTWLVNLLGLILINVRWFCLVLCMIINTMI